MAMIAELEKVMALIEAQRALSALCWEMAIETADSQEKAEEFDAAAEECDDLYLDATATLEEAMEGYIHTARVRMEEARDIERKAGDGSHASACIDAIDSLNDDDDLPRESDPDVVGEIIAAWDRIAPEALGSGVDADGNPDGSDDWDHPSAAPARNLLAKLNLTFDFSMWSDARALAISAARSAA